jgi:hypothetical protein
MSALPSHLELVQGVVLPRPVGADPVLDFVNTRSDWTTSGPARTEWLTSYEAFLIWNSYVGLLPPATVCPGESCGWLFLDARADAAGARWRPAATVPKSGPTRPALVS